mgnify:CR=1 FL=1
MKKLLLILALLPTMLLAQNSWINIQLLTDNYPGETSWQITPPGGSPIIIGNDSITESNFLYDTIIPIGGDIIVSIFDSYGDGLGASQWGGTDGWFLIQNDCQDTIMYVAGDFGLSYIDTLTIAPCAPPAPDVFGCIDINALNFDSLATADDGSCTYPACGGILSSNAYQNCYPGGQALAIFEWTTEAYNPSCETVKVWYTNAEGVGPYQYGVPPNATNFAVNAGNGQMPPNWSVEHYLQVEFADGTMSDTITYTPTPCIDGCTDPTQISYNPWATEDDGSCSGTTCDTSNQYQITMEITFDNWPSETSWIMNSLGVIDEAIVGTYDFNDIGQTYTYNFCVDQNAGFELIVNDDYGDGMAGSTSGGTMDGSIIIYDCSGDTIWYMDNPGFGDTLYSGAQSATPCSTIPTIDGCTDDDYQEFNLLANNDDGSCINLHIYGCTDSNAFNYDPTATMMDLIPDCNYELWIGDAGGDGWGNSYIGVYQNGIDLGTYTMGPGNYQQTFNLILDPGILVEVFYFEVGGPQQPPQEVQFQTWHNSFKLTNANGVELMYEGQNPFANNGQGALQSFDSPFFTKYTAIPFCGTTCIPTVEGCMDINSFNYDSNVNVDDGSCIEYIYGCTNEFAINYNPLANVEDNSCIPFINGCTDPIADNFNPLANFDDFSCYYIGCMDNTACNYNSIATISNGCLYPPTYYDCYNVCLNDVDSDGVCDELEVLGCTDQTALNFNINATDNDGSCIMPIYGCTDPVMFNYDATANTDNGSCIEFIYGCTDLNAFNYDATANTDNGTCVEIIIGCTDNIALNYDPLANTLDNSCCYIAGCTDSTALNYDSDACFDDGTCVVIIEGCADPNAYNYDPLVNLPDNTTCLYNAGCYGGPGIPYWLNDGCYAWVIDIDSYCCTDDWDTSCQSMYDYCQNGWPVSIEESESGTIIVYPNPTNDILNIDTRLEIDVEIYDMMGKLIISEQNTKRIMLNYIPKGIYNLVIKHDKLRVTKRIIKQ